MISITSMAINAIISFILYILKAVFSMLSWFIKKIAWLFKLLFCALPLTTILFILLIIANIFLLIVGIPQNDLLDNYEDVLYTDIQISQKLFDDLKIWWTLNVFNYRGNIAFVPLLILSAVMAIPVFTVFLSISVVLSFGRLLFYGVMIDICIYLIRAIFHKSFVAQFLNRYYILFPDKGKKHYEKSYEKWLRKHHEEFEDDDCRNYHQCRHQENFYEDIDEDDSEEFYEDDEYYSEDEDWDDEEEENYYEDDSEFYEDNESDYEDDYPEDYEDDSEPQSITDKSPSSFNFFAGCNSRESVDRKYKSLVKLYHPDNMDGDNAALTEINIQYSEAKKRFQ